MKKKAICLLLAGAMAVSGLAGCSNSSDGEKGSGESAEKLVIWGGVPGEDGPNEIISAWNEAHPETPAEYVRFVNDDTGNTKLDTALQSGEQIDVFFTYSADLLNKRASSGMLEDLGNYDADSFVEENILGGKDSFPQIDGKIYGVPTVTEPTGIMINKDMLDEKGITIPEDWTISDYEEIARQLTGEKDGKTVYGCTVYWGGSPLPIPKSILGGDEFYKSATESNFDAPEYRINTRFKEMMDEGIAMPYEEIFSRKLEVYAHPAFLSGEIAMMPFSAWMLRYVNDEENFPHDFITTFAPFPSTDDGTPNPYQSENNNMICMNSQSKNKETAWEFMKFWITDGYQYVAKMPAYADADEEQIVSKILGENPEERFDVEAYKKVMLRDDFKYIVPTITTAYSEITQIYKEECQNYFLGVTSEEEYYSNLKTRADEAIQSAQ